MPKEKFPFNPHGLADDEKEKIMEVVHLFEKELQIKDDKEFGFITQYFALFSHYYEVNTAAAYPLDFANNKAHLTITEVNIREHRPKSGYVITSFYQLWGFATLKSDLGHIVIRQENIVDKVYEWFDPKEIDFKNDPEFSDRFYVIGKDAEHTKNKLSDHYREAIMEISMNDIVIEIKGNHLIIGNRKPVDLNTALIFSDFLKKMIGIN